MDEYWTMQLREAADTLERGDPDEMGRVSWRLAEALAYIRGKSYGWLPGIDVRTDTGAVLADAKDAAQAKYAPQPLGARPTVAQARIRHLRLVGKPVGPVLIGPNSRVWPYA